MPAVDSLPMMLAMPTDLLLDHIRSVPDYPKKGVLFRDITPLLGHSRALRDACWRMASPFELNPPELVAGIEARDSSWVALLLTSLGPASFRSASRANSPQNPSAGNTHWNTGLARWNSTRTASKKAKGCFWSTISWPQGDRPRQRCCSFAPLARLSTPVPS